MASQNFSFIIANIYWALTICQTMCYILYMYCLNVILTITLWIKCYYYLFIIPTLQVRKLRKLPKVMWLVRNGDRIQTQAVQVPELVWLIFLTVLPPFSIPLALSQHIRNCIFNCLFHRWTHWVPEDKWHTEEIKADVSSYLRVCLIIWHQGQTENICESHGSH